MKNFKVSYSYPLEYPIKVVIKRLGLLGLTGWLYQKYATDVEPQDLVITERILEVPTFHEWMGRLFKEPKGHDVLEIGHVASHVSLELASMGYSVTAVDLRDYKFSHPNLTSIVGDFLKQDFKKQFDCVFSLSTIEHFGFSKRYGGFDDPNNTLDEDAFKKIGTSLKPGGHAIITVPYAKAWCEGIWFKVYTRKTLEEKLSLGMNIVEKRYYRRENNQWLHVENGADDPASPHDGVAMFLLQKK